MIIRAEDGCRGRVLDLETGRYVRHVIELDTDQSVVTAKHCDMNGNPLVNGDGNELPPYVATGRFRWIPAERRATPVPAGADACARCRSNLVLPGYDLCPRCNAQDKGLKNLCMRLLRTPLLDRRCEGKTKMGGRCPNLACYAVGDEVAVTPQRGTWGNGRASFTRAMTVRQRFYCEGCYRAPQLLDARGEVVKVFDEAGGVRPQ